MCGPPRGQIHCRPSGQLILLVKCQEQLEKPDEAPEN